MHQFQMPSLKYQYLACFLKKNTEKAELPKTHKEHQHGATAKHLFAHLPLRALLGWNYSCVILTANLSQGFEVLVLDGST